MYCHLKSLNKKHIINCLSLNTILLSCKCKVGPASYKNRQRNRCIPQEYYGLRNWDSCNSIWGFLYLLNKKKSLRNCKPFFSYCHHVLQEQKYLILQIVSVNREEMQTFSVSCSSSCSACHAGANSLIPAYHSISLTSFTDPVLSLQFTVLFVCFSSPLLWPNSFCVLSITQKNFLRISH